MECLAGDAGNDKNTMADPKGIYGGS